MERSEVHSRTTCCPDQDPEMGRQPNLNFRSHVTRTLLNLSPSTTTAKSSPPCGTGNNRIYPFQLGSPKFLPSYIPNFIRKGCTSSTCPSRSSFSFSSCWSHATCSVARSYALSGGTWRWTSSGRSMSSVGKTCCRFSVRCDNVIGMR